MDMRRELCADIGIKTHLVADMCKIGFARADSLHDFEGFG